MALHCAPNGFAHFRPSGGSAGLKRRKQLCRTFPGCDGTKNTWRLELEPGALDRVRIVLVGPQHAGNVGSVCRLAANFECKDVWLVAPECDYTAKEATYLAANAISREILEHIKVADILSQALVGCSMAVGFTRRGGNLRIPGVEFCDLHAPHANGPTLALVFGREDSGLSNEELAYCTTVCSIPSGRWQGSLNLSHAVGIVLSRLYEKSMEVSSEPPQAIHTMTYRTAPGTAAIEDVEFLVSRWKDVLLACNRAALLTRKPDYKTPERLILHIKRILQRARLSCRETAFLHGFLTVVEYVSIAAEENVQRCQETLLDAE